MSFLKKNSNLIFFLLGWGVTRVSEFIFLLRIQIKKKKKSFFFFFGGGGMRSGD